MGAPTAKLETVVIVSPYKILGLFFNIIALILLVVTMPTTFWIYVGNRRYGLWTECFLSSKGNNDENDTTTDSDNEAKANDDKTDFYCTLNNQVWIQICGSLIVVCLCCTIIGLILTLLGFFHKKRQERKIRFYRAASFVFFSGVLCIFVGLIVFPIMFLQEIQQRGKDKWFFGWSYGVGIGAAIFLLGAALLLCLDRNKEEIFYRERLYLNQDNDEENQIDNQEAKIKTLR